MDAFWKGFWDNWLLILIITFFFGGGVIEVFFGGLASVAKAFNKGRIGRIRQLQNEVDLLWQKVRDQELRQQEHDRVLRAWAEWTVAIRPHLEALQQHGLPAPPEPLSLDEWPLSEIATKERKQ